MSSHEKEVLFGFWRRSQNNCFPISLRLLRPEVAHRSNELDRSGFILLIVPFAALLISVISFYFSVKSWRESNRPLVTARVSSLGMGGNASIPLSLVVENTGTRPAKNIRMKVDELALNEFLVSNTRDSLGRQIKACFSSEGAIPVLANGKCVSNSFGLISDNDGQSTWKGDLRFDVQISYEDLDGRRFRETMPLFVKEDQAFASGFWVRSETANEN